MWLTVGCYETSNRPQGRFIDMWQSTKSELARKLKYENFFIVCEVFEILLTFKNHVIQEKQYFEYNITVEYLDFKTRHCFS